MPNYSCTAMSWLLASLPFVPSWETLLSFLYWQQTFKFILLKVAHLVWN
jgi:hypothetical protein